LKDRNRPEILVIEDRAGGGLFAAALVKRGFAARSPEGGGGVPVPADLHGCFPHYSAVLSVSGSRKDLPVMGAIAVQRPSLKADFESLGLRRSERVLSFSAFKELLPGLRAAPTDPGTRPLTVFLLGLTRESRPASTREVLDAASLLLDEPGFRVAVLHGNLKVSGAGIEARVRRMRRKGALFLGFARERPLFGREPDGRTVIRCVDEAARTPLVLRPDWTVLEETPASDPASASLAGVLGTGTGPDGLLPSDNVYYGGMETGRRGILGILPEADPLGRDSILDDLSAAMLEMRALSRMTGDRAGTYAVIDQRLCARCLTCFRSCPHGAVSIGERVEVSPEACFACGICAAACPGRAIVLSSDSAPTRPPRHPDIRPGDLVAFGCRRSAERAMALCRHQGRELPENLVFVPVECAGSISRQMLLDAFVSEASGVLVLACHPGNCHAERGNTEASARVEEVRGMLEEMGIDRMLLRFHTLAANTGVEFGRIVRDFSESLGRQQQISCPP
jgi:quinone-modifying oxidoreductase, subunit QmoB